MLCCLLLFGKGIDGLFTPVGLFYTLDNLNPNYKKIVMNTIIYSIGMTLAAIVIKIQKGINLNEKNSYFFRMFDACLEFGRGCKCHPLQLV